MLSKAFISSDTCYINGTLQTSFEGYNVTESMDTVTRTATLEFSAIDGGPYGFNDFVQIFQNNNVEGACTCIYTGFIQKPHFDRSPFFQFAFECWGWLGITQNTNLDARGIALGASIANGDIVPIGIKPEDALYYVLQAAGVPSASINIRNQVWTANYGASSFFLLASVIPYWAQSVTFWDICTDILSYNGWHVFEEMDGTISWGWISPVPGDPVRTYVEGSPDQYGYRNLHYGRDSAYTYNRVEVDGVDVSGIAQCQYVYALKQGESVKDFNGQHVIPDNPLNDQDPRHNGYNTFMFSSNMIDVVTMAAYVAERIYAETNQIYEELTMDVFPKASLRIGQTIALSSEPHYGGKANGNWVIVGLDRSYSAGNGGTYGLTCARGNFGGMRYSG